jgi:hypothetical protein
VTVAVIDAEIGLQVPPEAVRVKVAVPLYPASGIHVVVSGVEPVLSVNDPPTLDDQIALVASPTIEPPNAAVVPP